jgi:hypothetical protein
VDWATDSFDERRVQLIGGAVEVDVGPRGTSPEKRRAMSRRAVEEEIDEGVL